MSAFNRALAWILALPHGDKIAHAIAGAAVGSIALYVLGSDLLSLLVVAVAGAGKDWWLDRARPDSHIVDPWDAVATIGGYVLLRSLVGLAQLT